MSLFGTLHLVVGENTDQSVTGPNWSPCKVMYGNGKSNDDYARFDPCHASTCVLCYISVLCKY
jgi:hypothetical protein